MKIIYRCDKCKIEKVYTKGNISPLSGWTSEGIYYLCQACSMKYKERVENTLRDFLCLDIKEENSAA